MLRFTVDFSLLWPHRLSSLLGNPEVCCDVVNYIFSVSQPNCKLPKRSWQL